MEMNPDVTRPQTRLAAAVARRKHDTRKSKNRLLIAGIVLLAVVFVIAWLGLWPQRPAQIQLSRIELPEPGQTPAPVPGRIAVEPQESANTGTIQPDDVAPAWRTTVPPDMPGNDPGTSIEPAERQAMAEAAQQLAALPSPAVDQTGTTSTDANPPRQVAAGIIDRTEDTTVMNATGSPVPQETPVMSDEGVSEPAALPASSAVTPERVDTPAVQASVPESHDAVMQKHPADTHITTHGRWTINLISTKNQAVADRLAERAQAQDLHTVQQQITLKGTPYWRVQITGFSTEAEANAYAGTVKEKLGLKEVWILKR